MCYAVYGLLDDVGIAELRAVDDVAAVLGQEPRHVVDNSHLVLAEKLQTNRPLIALN